MTGTPASARTVLLTGCSSGIGLACARTMKARGWRVLATARKQADLARLEQQEGVEALHLELADPASVAACAAEALARTGNRLDALFNNAAYGQVGAVEDLSVDVLRRQFEVNVLGGHGLIKALLPAMRAQGHGRIVQCSSVLGLVVAPYRGAYCASKFAVEALSDALRLELAGTGIHVALIEPGPIRTEFIATAVKRFRETIDADASAHHDAYVARMKSLEPEAVAAKLVHALESPRPGARYFVTVPTYYAALLRRLLPTRLLDRILAGT